MHSFKPHQRVLEELEGVSLFQVACGFRLTLQPQTTQPYHLVSSFGFKIKPPKLAREP